MVHILFEPVSVRLIAYYMKVTYLWDVLKGITALIRCVINKIHSPRLYELGQWSDIKKT